MTGTERMYGVVEVLSRFLDRLPRNSAITPAVQREAQMAAYRWLMAHPLTEPTLASLSAENVADDEPPAAVNA